MDISLIRQCSPSRETACRALQLSGSAALGVLGILGNMEFGGAKIPNDSSEFKIVCMVSAVALDCLALRKVMFAAAYALSFCCKEPSSTREIGRSGVLWPEPPKTKPVAFGEAEAGELSMPTSNVTDASEIV